MTIFLTSPVRLPDSSKYSCPVQTTCSAISAWIDPCSELAGLVVDSLSYNMERGLLDILEKEIGLQRRLDILKREVEIRFDNSSLAAYRSVDR